MHTLLFILYAIQLGTVTWIDISWLLAMLTLVTYIYRFARSRVTKKDMDIALGKKASKSMVQSELKLVDQRIQSVTEISKMQDKYLKETLEEHHAILDTIQSDIKILLQKK